MDYNVNDTVLYGAEGVFRIDGISSRRLNGADVDYYVLMPVRGGGYTIFVPVSGENASTKMRHVLSVDEINALIKAIPGECTIWIEDNKPRREHFRKILAGNDRTELVRLIKTLYMRRQVRKTEGKKMYVEDERFMREAEKILYDEFAHVLNLEREQVSSFLLEHVQYSAAEPHNL